MPDLKVVQLERPLLTDIPSMLRSMADKIESGEYEDADTVFVLMPVAGDYPRLFGWGDIEGSNEPIIQLDLAKHWLLSNMVARR